MHVKVGIAVMAILASTTGVSADPPAATPTGIDAATRSRVIQSVIEHLNAGYVFPDAAKKMEADLKAREDATSTMPSPTARRSRRS